MEVVLLDVSLVDGVRAGGPTGPTWGVQFVLFGVLLLWPDEVAGELVLHGVDLVLLRLKKRRMERSQ